MFGDVESLQRGAQIFNNYCLSCHSASYALQPSARPGAVETQNQRQPDVRHRQDWRHHGCLDGQKEAGTGPGATPPDLTVIVSRFAAADYLYRLYARFYRDESRPTGWNKPGVRQGWHAAHPVGMARASSVWETVKNKEGRRAQARAGQAGLLTKLENGKADTSEYDKRAADLVNYMVYMSEPSQVKREQIGYVVILFLALVMFRWPIS